MGNMNAHAFADAVGEGQVRLLAALSWHLTSNHYPPLPGTYTEPLAEAIDRVARGEGMLMIPLPEGIQPVPRRATQDEDTGIWYVAAEDLVEACNAWAFVEEEQ